MSKDQSRRPTGSGWPTLSYEEVEWRPKMPVDMVSQSLRELHHGPYRAAVVPPIERAEIVLPSQTLALADEASQAIARFDAEIGSEVAPFAAILLRSESASSSMIENLSSGAKAIALADLGSDEKRNASEIVGNVRAMQAAVALSDALNEESVLAMHRALMEHLHSDIAGRWRDEQVWIGGDGYGPHGAAFVPPRQERVAASMADLMAYARRRDVPALAQTAIAHAQFETIHPFPDGNGRTGRALIHSLLRNKRVTKNVTVPVSAGLLTDTDRYFNALTSYRDGDPTQIVDVISHASFRAVENGRTLATDIRQTRAAWIDRIKARRDSTAWTLADLALRQPVFDADLVAQQLGVSVVAARTAIDHLVSVGILDEFTGFKRNRMWQSREILSALDAFAQRAGRRG